MIGVIGAGFVGGAVRDFFLNHGEEVLVYDVDPTKRNAELADLVTQDAILFIAVPTPMDEKGRCHTRIVQLTFERLNEIAVKKGVRIHAVLKSTVPPGTTELLNTEAVNAIFNPEFLTEANAYQDFVEQNRIVLGGKDVGKVEELYRKHFPTAVIIQLYSAKDAEMVKYMTNAFLATKVAFSNEMWQICQAMGIDHELVTKALSLDDRLGKTHWKVPGPDGHFGFGGTCFPKDINAIIKVAESFHLAPTLLQAVWEKNLSLRPERDWEGLKGRAVTE
jgi:UDPglucose 6-dehydrogenase